jgi:recombination protein RecT
MASSRKNRRSRPHEALDEIYIRLEADFEGADLEALMREYRRIKAKIGSLI